MFQQVGRRTVSAVCSAVLLDLFCCACHPHAGDQSVYFRSNICLTHCRTKQTLLHVYAVMPRHEQAVLKLCTARLHPTLVTVTVGCESSVPCETPVPCCHCSCLYPCRISYCRRVHRCIQARRQQCRCSSCRVSVHTVTAVTCTMMSSQLPICCLSSPR
jgi:hypothetical protein